jgi:transcription elongation factor Elf1
MKSIPLKLEARYSTCFMCPVCGKSGIINWQPIDGDSWDCTRCKTSCKVSFKLDISTLHTIKRYLKKNG